MIHATVCAAETSAAEYHAVAADDSAPRLGPKRR
jgi:hypothetical protein